MKMRMVNSSEFSGLTEPIKELALNDLKFLEETLGICGQERILKPRSLRT